MKKSSKSDHPLPRVNVEYIAAGDFGDMTPEKIRAMICNPVYTGLGPYEAILDDEKWIRSAVRMIETEGTEQFLVNMLYVLRKSLGTGGPAPSDE
jgi:hypothetical protein